MRELTNHMLLGTRTSVQLLAGASQQDVLAGLDDDLMADNQDPIADFGHVRGELIRTGSRSATPKMRLGPWARAIAGYGRELVVWRRAF